MLLLKTDVAVVPSGGCCGAGRGPAVTLQSLAGQQRWGGQRWHHGEVAKHLICVCPCVHPGSGATLQRGVPQWAGKQEPWACSKLQEHSGTHPAPSGEGSGWVSVSLSALGSTHLSLGASICPWGRPSASPVPWGSVAVCVLSHYRALAVASLACYSRNK